MYTILTILIIAVTLTFWHITSKLTKNIQHLNQRVSTLEAELAEQRTFNSTVMRDSQNIHETIAQSQGAK